MSHNRLVLYEMVSPGFEAVYTGERVDRPLDPPPASAPIYRPADAEGKVYLFWSTWTWTRPDGADGWDDGVRAINAMQRALGFDIWDQVLRVYAYLGAERTSQRCWLSACLWYGLAHNPMMGNPAGLERHADLLARADRLGVSLRTWRDTALS